MAQIIPAVVEAAFNGFDTQFAKGYSSAETFWQKLAMKMMSSHEQETYAWPDLLPNLREWVGARVFNNAVAQAQVLVNKKYEGSMELDRTRFEDDSLGLFNAQAEMLGQAAAQWPDILMAACVEAGHSTLTFDGQYFFDTDHPIDTTGEVTASTQSNLYTGTALSANNVQAVWAGMANLKGRNNKPMNVNGRILMVPPALRKTALDIANAELVNGGDTNTLAGTVEVLVNPYLTSATTWYMLDTSKPIKPFIWQLRSEPKTTMKNKEEDDNVFLEDTYRYGVRARGAAGYGLYFLASKCTA